MGVHTSSLRFKDCDAVDETRDVLLGWESTGPLSNIPTSGFLRAGYKSFSFSEGLFVLSFLISSRF